MGAIRVHHTETDDGAWDGPANEARLKTDQDMAFFQRAYAWRDSEGDETVKSSYKFIHHFVDGEGNPGAASTRACSAGIAVLNGGRGGTTIPRADRQGVYSHLAAHLKDAEKDVPELKSADEEEEMEVRSYPVEMRVVNAEKPTIEGRAVVYGKKSELLFGMFREVIEPGFFEGVLKQDVRALWNHNADLVLGRTKSGTLELIDTERSLDVRIDPPDTQVGRDAVTLIGRGDVSQMSFGFVVKQGGDEWKKERDGTQTRILKRGGCERLFDVSPVTYPAYPQTSVAVRSMMEQLGLTAEETPLDPAPTGRMPRAPTDRLENAEAVDRQAAEEEARGQVPLANLKRGLDFEAIVGKVNHETHES
jgi:hypothetical protein